MALSFVSDFVRKDGSELAFTGSGCDKTGMNGNETSGQCERIDGGIADREKEKGIKS